MRTCNGRAAHVGAVWLGSAMFAYAILSETGVLDLGAFARIYEKLYETCIMLYE